MLKALLTNVSHEFLQIWNFGDGSIAKSVQFVIGQFAFANIRAYAAIGIGSRDAAKGQWAGGRAAFQSPIGIFHAKCAAEDGRVRDFNVGQETLGPVAAVEQDAFVIIVRVVIVPVYKRGWCV